MSVPIATSNLQLKKNSLEKFKHLSIDSQAVSLSSVFEASSREAGSGGSEVGLDTSDSTV